MNNEELSVKSIPENISENEQKLIRKTLLNTIDLVLMRVKNFKNAIKNDEIEDISYLQSLFSSIANELKHNA